MTNLSYQAELKAHYRAVKARLWKPKLPTRLVIPPKPHIPATPAQKPKQSLRAAIMSLRDEQHIDSFKLLEIMNAVAQVTGVSIADIIGPRRFPKIVNARHLFFWISSNYTTQSQPRIAKFCKLNATSSVWLAVHKINADQPRWQSQIDATLALLGTRE